MKMRNKKTGEIVTFVTIEEIHDDELDFTYIKKSGHENELSYSSLKKFNDEWEDYAPAEPLIKDEKIRNAVRAWWKTVPDVVTDKRILYKKNQDLAVGIYSIYCGTIIPELDVGRMYTIAELCGEDE